MEIASEHFTEFNNKNSGVTVNGSCLENNPEIVIFSLNGYIDTNNSFLLDKAICAVIDEIEQLKTLVFDLKKLTYISSTGIGLLTNIQMKTNTKNIRLFFFRNNEKIGTIINSLGFAGMFKSIDSIEEIFQNESSTDTLFPLKKKCSHCETMVKFLKSGTFRCAKCKSILKIDNKGKYF